MMNETHTLNLVAEEPMVLDTTQDEDYDTNRNHTTDTNAMENETEDVHQNILTTNPEDDNQTHDNSDKQQTVQNTNDDVEENEESSNNVKRSRFGRILKPNTLHKDYIPWDNISDSELGYNCEVIPKGPKTAMKHEEWRKAMQEEYDSLIENKVWHLVKRTKQTIPISGKWCFTHKYGPNGEIIRYKARYVARGFSQIHGRDYDETYSPTVRYTTIRTILALAAQRGMNLHQMDIKTAYLNATVDEDIYLEQPIGFVQTGNNGEELICKLDKSLYGLKQSGRNWHHELKNFLINNGFKPAEYDSCLFTRKNKDGKLDVILVWVDDLILCSENHNFATTFKKEVEKKYKVSEFCKLHWFLGMNITVDEKINEIRVNQKKYINTLLQKHDMDKCKAVATPALENTKLSKQDCPEDGSEEQNEMKKVDYRGIVGSLNYLAQSTRPDISFIAHRLSCFVNNPAKIHYMAAKRVLRYLQGTKDMELTYRRDEKGINITAVSDADWAGNTDNSKSTSGYAVKLNTNSAAISWNSKQQNTIALSTAEAELTACKMAVQEVMYIQGLLEDINTTIEKPIDVYADNQAMIAMCNNQSQFSRTKHVAIAINFVKDMISKQHIKLNYLPTSEMPADLLTKHLGRIKTHKFMFYFNGHNNMKEGVSGI
jgi:hypothetical protein